MPSNDHSVVFKPFIGKVIFCQWFEIPSSSTLNSFDFMFCLTYLFHYSYVISRLLIMVVFIIFWYLLGSWFFFLKVFVCLTVSFVLPSVLHSLSTLPIRYFFRSCSELPSLCLLCMGFLSPEFRRKLNYKTTKLQISLWHW